ncbi:MAG: DNA polymerase III subunit gamma/tau [Thermomicrobiales bacterium]
MTLPSLFGTSEGSDPNPASNDPRHSSSREILPASASSLYRKHRPQTFDADEIVGQDHVVRTLRNAILLDRVAHAYLFSGPRGTGKTTTARLLAKGINCLHPDRAARPCNVCANCAAINAGSAPDVIEIDAASNRGIDDIRDLRDRVRYAPVQLPRKVYIIDEAHQITGAAANAFLKTLEEPPVHTHFILATTDPEELLPTIVSRCQRFEFRRVDIEAMERRLALVAEREGASITPEALRAIARHATGSLRDALGLLEQLTLQNAVASNGEPGEIDLEEVQAALGLSQNERVETLVEALARKHPGDALQVVQEATDAGEDPRQLNRQLLSYLRQLLYIRAGSSVDADEKSRSLAQQFSLDHLAAHARRFSEIDFSIKHSPFPQLPLEVALVQAIGDTEASAPDSRQQPTASGEVTPDATAPAETRPTSLRDRVRGTSSARESLPPRLEPMSSPTASITPIRPMAPVPVIEADPGSDDLVVERIVDLWPAIRADVKALNRRIEALLSEVDPVAVSGKHVTLAAPYPFHRDKLNADDVRETIAGVLSRQLARPVTITCVLRGETVPTSQTLVAQSPVVETAGAPVEASPGDDEARIEARVRAAKNIFDAEEVADLPLRADQQSASPTN